MTHKIITIGDGAANIAKLISIETSKTIIIVSLGGSKSRNAVEVITANQSDDLVVILVMPMLCEGPTRNSRAEEYKKQIEVLTKNITVFSNETYSHLNFKQAFAATDIDVMEFILNLNCV
ncbi:MAG: hypothetical protein RSA66_09985 [Muribaculaceae bacterium]